MGALVVKILSLRGETELSRESDDWAKIKIKWKCVPLLILCK